MGAAAVEGANPWVLSCVKHFALNSMEEARFRVDVRVDEDVLREVYLPHFRTVVEAGADCVMSAYNSVNGEWAGQNRHLLTDVLREEWGFPGFVMTDGLRERLGERLIHVGGDDPAAAAAAARGADAAVVVVGLSSVDEGESLIGVDTAAIRLLGGIARFRPVAAILVKVAAQMSKRKKLGGDRRDLRLRAGDVALIGAVAAVNARTVVVVIGGGTIVLDPWDADVAALLLAWYPGMEGGHAVADILLGDAEPAGRLPMAIPHRQSDLPQVDWDAGTVTYGRWWGQRGLDRDGVPAAYPLGFGLGYTTFGIGDLEVGELDGDRFAASVTVTNTGARPGRHVVQIYALQPADTGRPVHHLVGFRSVHLDPGGSERVAADCSIRPIQRWATDGFATAAGSITIRAASHAGDPAGIGGTLTFP